MYLNCYKLRNFRRLENVEIKLQDDRTIFVGANNSGKTSATSAFRLFISQAGGFKIHDFSSPLIEVFDKFGKLEIQSLGEYELPNMELDLWFTVSPETEYGKIAHFLPSIASDYSEIGVRISFSVNDPIALHNAYSLKHPKIESGSASIRKPLSFFLSQSDNLKSFFGLKYFMLEQVPLSISPDGITACALDKSEGQKAIAALLRVDYVDAQRNIADSDSASSNRLSAVFADFYKYNLKKQDSDPASVKAIDESNSKLTDHYAEQFKSLIAVIKSLGFPALKIAAASSPM